MEILQKKNRTTEIYYHFEKKGLCFSFEYENKGINIET